MLYPPTKQVFLAPFSLKQRVIHRSALILMVPVNLRKKYLNVSLFLICAADDKPNGQDLILQYFYISKQVQLHYFGVSSFNLMIKLPNLNPQQTKFF